MQMNVWEKIEQIREQPEHIRMRYVFICLTVSMVFVIGIWFLSLKESFRNIRRDVADTAKQGEDQLSGVPIPSPDSLLKQSAPLNVNSGNEKTGEQYFEEQFRTQSGRSEDSENTSPDTDSETGAEATPTPTIPQIPQ